MIGTEALNRHLRCVTYKQGWTFTVYDGAWEGQHLVIGCQVPDSYHPGKTVTLDIHSMLPPMPSIDYFNRWLAWRLARIEVHEMREFLRFQDKPLFDPHAEHAEHDRF